MFTGLVEEIGKILSINKSGQASKIQVEAHQIMSDLKIDDSVSVNGVCLTVIDLSKNAFTAEAVEETISKTSLKYLKVGTKVNMERALTLSTRLGGHLVLGHIDTIGKVLEIRRQNLGTMIKFSFPEQFKKYIVQTGSICIDGVSLTLAENTQNTFTISVIPHTIENTILKDYSSGTIVNLEFDILGKFVEKMLIGKSDWEGQLKEFLSS